MPINQASVAKQVSGHGLILPLFKIAICEHSAFEDFVEVLFERSFALEARQRRLREKTLTARRKDRVGINAMDATEEEKAMAKETIDSLREENRLLTIERNGLKMSRDDYQNKLSQTIKQCSINQFVIKKLNKQITELQAKNSHTPKEEPLPF